MNNTSTTSDKILASARALLITGGYNGFSYADIAETIGIRKASIHHHFPGKVDLVRTLLRLYRQEMEMGTSKIDLVVTNPLDKLRTYTSYWEKCISDQSAPLCICALLASELPALPEEIQIEIKAFFTALSTWLTTVFEDGAKQKSFSLLSEPAVEAESFMAMIHGAMLSARAYGNPKMFGIIVNPLLERIAIH
ncbi:MAG: TetR/AcrR family transcriptional regulator [Cellvibrio sp.]|uniref:TetR/AcrR family transcriptional regulator n=1 Tax=Cellvibrio sp. TaxID=1965322 RepID=UPI0031AB2604